MLVLEPYVPLCLASLCPEKERREFFEYGTMLWQDILVICLTAQLELRFRRALW